MIAQKVFDTVSGYIPLEDFTSSASLHSPGDESGAASNTISAVRDLCNPAAQKHIKVDVSSFVLIEDSMSPGKTIAAEDSSMQFVKDLSVAARSAAPSHACSSVLAGHASESDEYADVGLWLSAGSVSIDPADGSSGKAARALLSCLGLDSLLSSQITPLSLSSETNAPVAFKASAQDEDVQRLSSLLAKLSHTVAFTAAAPDGKAFHVLVGQMPVGESWVGLLSAGIWSDQD